MFCWYAQGCQSAAAELSSTKQQLPHTSPPSDFFIFSTACPSRLTWAFGDAKHCEEAAHFTLAAFSPMPVSSFSAEKEEFSTGPRSTKSFNQGVRAAPSSCFPLGSLRLRSPSFCGLRYRLCCSLDSFSLFLLVLCLRFYLTWFW